MRGFSFSIVLFAAALPCLLTRRPRYRSSMPFRRTSVSKKMVNGEYPPMKRDGALVGAIQRAWDNSPGSAGIFVVRYSADQVIKIRLREFMTSTIVLPEWETISTHVLGDAHGFKVVKTQPNILVASASITGADTSLTVVGDSGRVYSFYVRSEGYNSPNIPDLTVFVKADAPHSASSSG